MKLHELSVGTRFCFSGGDIDYEVVHKSDDTIHFVRFGDEPAYIVNRDHENSWNVEVEMA